MKDFQENIFKFILYCWGSQFYGCMWLCEMFMYDLLKELEIVIFRIVNSLDVSYKICLMYEV